MLKNKKIVCQTSAPLRFHGIFLWTVGLPRRQNNWTKPSSCYLLAQRAENSRSPSLRVVPLSLALTRSLCWVVWVPVWRSRLIDNSICVGVITAWLIDREERRDIVITDTPVQPLTYADGGRGSPPHRGRHGGTFVWMWICVCEKMEGTHQRRGPWGFRVGLVVAETVCCYFSHGVFDYMVTIVLCSSLSAIDNFLSHTHPQELLLSLSKSPL